MSAVQAIPKRKPKFVHHDRAYHGYGRPAHFHRAFASLTEAKWAAMFFVGGVVYEYESGPQPDGVAYLPDFWLPEYDLFLEVKPRSGQPTNSEIRLLRAFADQHLQTTRNRYSTRADRPLAAAIIRGEPFDFKLFLVAPLNGIAASYSDLAAFLRGKTMPNARLFDSLRKVYFRCIDRHCFGCGNDNVCTCKKGRPSYAKQEWKRWCEEGRKQQRRQARANQASDQQGRSKTDRC